MLIAFHARPRILLTRLIMLESLFHDQDTQPPGLALLHAISETQPQRTRTECRDNAEHKKLKTHGQRVDFALEGVESILQDRRNECHDKAHTECRDNAEHKQLDFALEGVEFGP